MDVVVTVSVDENELDVIVLGIGQRLRISGVEFVFLEFVHQTRVHSSGRIAAARSPAKWATRNGG